jgi:hypothetical protein
MRHTGSAFRNVHALTEATSGYRRIQEARTWATRCLEPAGNCCSSASGGCGGLERLGPATRPRAPAGNRTRSICRTASPGTHCNRQTDMQRGGAVGRQADIPLVWLLLRVCPCASNINTTYKDSASNSRLAQQRLWALLLCGI